MIKDPQIIKMRDWLVRLNFIGPFLLGLGAAALISINYELPIIIAFLVGVVVFTLVFIISVILWKYTIGYLLAVCVGLWWGYKTRNDDRR